MKEWRLRLEEIRERRRGRVEWEEAELAGVGFSEGPFWSGLEKEWAHIGPIDRLAIIGCGRPHPDGKASPQKAVSHEINQKLWVLCVCGPFNLQMSSTRLYVYFFWILIFDEYLFLRINNLYSAYIIKEDLEECLIFDIIIMYDSHVLYF